jgi:hypothetical protein
MKHIDDAWPNKFKDEVWILRLSIDMDGVNPYSLQNTNYCIWTLVVINNNIPPWFSMKNECIMLALIVSGRIQVKIMDVYAQPLINSFKKQWEWIHVYDVSRLIPMERYFMLYGICVYTMHNNLGLGFFSSKHVD